MYVYICAGCQKLLFFCGGGEGVPVGGIWELYSMETAESVFQRLQQDLKISFNLQRGAVR